MAEELNLLAKLRARQTSEITPEVSYFAPTKLSFVVTELLAVSLNRICF